VTPPSARPAGALETLWATPQFKASWSDGKTHALVAAHFEIHVLTGYLLMVAVVAVGVVL
jgi:hypothetical protein